MAAEAMSEDHLHIYNMRGYCWCGAHRDDWLRNEDMLERIGKAFSKLVEEVEELNIPRTKGNWEP